MFPPAPAPVVPEAALFFWVLLLMDSTWGAGFAGVAGFDPVFVAPVEAAGLPTVPDGRSFVPSVAGRRVGSAFGTLGAAAVDCGAAAFFVAFAGAAAGAFVAFDAGADFAGAFLTGFAGGAFLTGALTAVLATFLAGAFEAVLLTAFLAGAFLAAGLAADLEGVAFLAAGLADFFAAGAAFFAVFLVATSAFSFFP